jgi:hypothetical protein
MFLKQKPITAKRDSRCNAFKCNVPILKGDSVIWTVHTYRTRTISAVWHKDCHRMATTYAPYWDRLVAIREGRDILPLPLECYCPITGKVKKQ